MSKDNLRIIPKTKWKKLKVEETNIDAEFLDGFLGIEELTDYDLTDDGIALSKNKEELPQLKPQFRKRKLYMEYETTVDESTTTTKLDGTNHDSKDEKPPLKKKKKAKSKKKVTKTSYNQCIKSTPTSEECIADQIEEVQCAKAVDENAGDEEFNGWINCFVPEPVLRALSELKFNAPTQIQALTLPSAIRDRRDILGAAETGSGKTLAFGIPIIHHILREKEAETEPVNKFRCLIMTPTRELAVQIKNHLVAAAKYTDITICVVLGGMASEKQYRLLKRKPDIVIATPGRLWELILEEEPHLMEVKNIQYLVVDEADRMLEAGHFEEFSKLLAMINSGEESKAKRQTFIFSATLTFVHKLPQRILKRKKKKALDSTRKLNQFMKSIGIKENPKIVDITQKSGTCETLIESRIHCSNLEKDYFLYYLLVKYPGKTIVFCNSIDCVRRLSKLFLWLELNPLPLHASMHQKQRLKNLERFSGQGKCFLIATDVAARGLDIPNIEHVIHYQVPRTSESYIHRSGRTARATKEGISILLIDSSEQNSYQKICRNLNKGLKELPLFPVDSSIMKEIKLRVNAARQLDLLEHRNRRVRTQNNWIESVAKALDMDLENTSEVLNDMGDEKQQAKEKREMKSLKQYLSELLRKPIRSQNYITRYPASITKPVEEILEPVKVETAITAARREKKYVDQLKKDLKIVDKRAQRIKENRKKRNAKKLRFSKK